METEIQYDDNRQVHLMRCNARRNGQRVKSLQRHMQCIIMQMQAETKTKETRSVRVSTTRHPPSIATI